MQLRYLKLLIIFLIASNFIGCTAHVRPISTSYQGSERVFRKNYEIGQKLAAYVGEPIVKVKSYKIDRFKSLLMRPTDDFVISGGLVTIIGSKNIDYLVIGQTTIENQTYTVVSTPSDRAQNKGILIKPDGTVYNKVLNRGKIMVYTFDISPPDLKFYKTEDEKRIVDADYINYELIYGGTDGKSITVTYREYTKNDMARPAFYQNLVYESGQRRIRFKKTVLEIHEATNEKIVYTIIDDDLK